LKTDEDDIEEWLKNDVCEVGFLCIIDIVSAAVTQKCKEEGGGNESEIHAAVRSLCSSQKQAAVTKYFSKCQL
jgi:hypothetical protein